MLRVTGLTKTYGSGELAVHAVRDVSFEAHSGEFVALVGPSGSGKTTLLAMLGGLLTPTSGSIEVDGTVVTSLGDRARAGYRRDRVGYVFQANNLISFLTAHENLMITKAIGGRFPSGSPSQRADRLLRDFDLERRSNTLASHLSGGERQRVAVARALMNDPALVLVDEPTASLDSERGRQLVELLVREVKTRGKLGIMVTHDFAMARMADRVLEVRDGRLIDVAQPAPR